MSSTKSPPEIEQHYDDAHFYDHFYARRKVDVKFYEEFGVEHGGPVLELGIGTGRIAIALARRGIEVTGVDKMETMLERAKLRISREPRRVRDRITLRQGDFRHVRLRRKFPLVIAPFNVLMHMYSRTDFEAAARTVKLHLARRGSFVLDVMLPDPWDLSRNPNRLFRVGKVTDPRTKERYQYTEMFSYDALRQIYYITMGRMPLRRGVNAIRSLLVQRQFFPAELEALLHYNGFRIEHRWGDFERRPLRGDDQSQVYVCRAKA